MAHHRLLFTLCLLLFSFYSFADDGGTSNPREWTYGNIYVKEPSKEIALRRELMTVSIDDEKPFVSKKDRKGRLSANFVFENLSDELVVVDCAFPIRVTIDFDNFYNVGLDSSRADRLAAYYGIALERNVRYEAILEPEYDHYVTWVVSDEERKNLEKKLKVWSARDFYQIEQVKELSFCHDFVIQQDGADVSVENVGVETRWVDGKLEMTFHMHHRLKFSSKRESNVKVSYPIEIWMHDYKEFFYGFKYDIYTGGTWAGSMRSFMLLTPFEMSSNSENKENVSFKCWKTPRYHLYYKENYKPVEGDWLYIYCGDNQELLTTYFPIRRKPSPFITNLKGSESVENVEALTDGTLYSYCRSNDWKNAWLEFSLDCCAVGPFFVNGMCGNSMNELFVRSACKDYGYSIIQGDYRAFRDSLWDNGNRVKSMTIEFPNGQTKDLNLKDHYSALPSTKGWVTSNCVANPCLLDSGTYKLTWKSLYYGDKGKETGLSEMWFAPVDGLLAKILDEDRKSDMPIYSNVLPTILNQDWTDPKYGKDEWWRYEKLPSQRSEEYNNMADTITKVRFLDYYEEDGYESFIGGLYEFVTDEEIASIDSSNVQNVASAESSNGQRKSGNSLKWLIMGLLFFLVAGGVFVFLKRK